MSGTPEGAAQTTSRTASAAVDQCGWDCCRGHWSQGKYYYLSSGSGRSPTHGKAYLEG